MPVVIALLRGVNVGGNCQLPMVKLREICGSLGLEDTVTYIQSGNAVFRTKQRNLCGLAREMEGAIEAAVGFRPAVALRTLAEWEALIEANPFAGREGLLPARLLVTFLVADPGDEGRRRVSSIDASPEEMHAIGSELYIYFVEGVGKTKLPFKAIDKALGAAGTARNWNTVLKLRDLAQALGQESTGPRH
jgi:uncharacterized protein (DUF1697 family)